MKFNSAPRRLKRMSIPSLVILICLPLLVITSLASHAYFTRAATPTPSTPAFNYGEALHQAIYYYEEQSSGPKAAWNRVPWIGSSAVHDGSDVGLDLSGGWYTSGNHVKFGLPMAYSATMLAWGVVANPQAYAKDGQLQSILNNLRWVNDYFLKAHPAPDVLYGQVGNLSIDGPLWEAAEVMQSTRPSYKIDASCPGSDLAGETAAAMASASLVFRWSDPAYASKLLLNAEQLYSFADNFRGKYDACIPAADASYPSYSGYNDELVWGATWLYLATHKASYLNKAESYYANLGTQTLGQAQVHSYKWSINWDDVSYGCYVLLAEITGKQLYKDDAQRWLDWWTVGVGGSKVTYSPGGEAFLVSGGGLRYSSSTAFVALIYADYLGKNNPLYARYHDFAVQQINYILGANPRGCSYVVGFGSCYPQVPHQADAHDSWTDDVTSPTYNRHILYGALVGGPLAPDDTFIDDRQNFGSDEPTADFNAAFTGALARLYEEYGGKASTSLPDKPKDDDEIYAMASVGASTATSTTIKAVFINKTGWPARVTDNLSMRYYFTLEAGVTPAMITVNSMSSQCGNNYLSGPTLYSGNTYYVTASCAGTLIYPGGVNNYQKQVAFTITSAGAWDPANDWSYQGIGALGTDPVKIKNIPVYDGKNLVWGATPPLA